MSEIWNLSTLCRCCHADGNFKSLNLSYQGENEIEIFETMLKEILGVSMCLTLEASYTICEDCIVQLRNAARFRKQVLMCEKNLKIYCSNEQFASTLDEVKFEADNDSYGNDDDTQTDQPDEDITRNVKQECCIKVDIKHPIDNVKNENQPNNEIIVEEDTNEVTKDKHTNVPKTTVKNNIKKTKKCTEITKDQKKPEPLNSSLIIKEDKETGPQFSCKDCGRSCQTQKEIKRHILKAHPVLFICEYCPKRLKSSLIYKRHLKLHIGNKTKCSFCPKKFASAHTLKDHLKSHMVEKIFICDTCQKQFKNRQTITRHIRIHDGTNKKKLCDLCGRGFNDKTNLNAHIQSVHQKLRPYHCKLCGKSFTNRRHLRDHLKQHNGDQKTYKCDICDHRLSCQKSMDVHRLRHENKFMCRLCSKIFDTKSLRKEHFQLVHCVGFENCGCPICGKILAGKYSLKRHVDEHKGIKNFPCNICGEKFSQKVVLNRHLFRKHNPEPDSNIGKTKCDICKRSFKNITLHMNSHNKRYFACEICEKTYTDNSTLNRHKESKHFGRTFDCEDCGKKYLYKAKLITHKAKIHKIKIEKDSLDGS